MENCINTPHKDICGFQPPFRKDKRKRRRISPAALDVYEY